MLPKSYVTYVLIAINVLVWIANVASGLDPMSPDPRALLGWGGNFLPATMMQPWRLLTATVLHGGIIHLALNMLALYQTGPIAEFFYGKRQYLFIYLVAGILGSVASLFFSARASVSVGASGAIFGIVGCLLAALFTKAHRLNPDFVKATKSSMLLFVGYSMVMGFTSSHIDNSAHIGGLVSGFILGYVLAEHIDQEEFKRQALPRFATALALVGASTFFLWGLLPTV
jgi:rhomboid protease GluP